MKPVPALVCAFLMLTSLAFAAPFTSVTNVEVSASDPAGPSQGSTETDPITGQVTTFQGRGGTEALARYIVDDAGIGLSAQVVTSGAPGSSARLAFTFNTTKPITIAISTNINQGTTTATFDDGPMLNLDGVMTAPAGTHTIRLTATTSESTTEANANVAMFFDIAEDKSGGPDPGPGPDPAADTLTWRNYVNGLWDDAAKWEPAVAPGSLDSVSFKVIPAAPADRTVPLPDIIVTSTGDVSREVAALDVLRSAVNLRNFSLATIGGPGVTNTLRISDGGRLTLDAPSGLPAPGYVDFATTNAIVGLGKPRTVAPSKKLSSSQLTIGPNVRWVDSGSEVVVGRTMSGALTVESRSTDPAETNKVGDLSLGLARRVQGRLSVSGRLRTDQLFIGAAGRSNGLVFVGEGGRLVSGAAVLASKKGSSGAVFISDDPVDEPGTILDYTSEGQRTEWGLTSLEVSGPANGGAGSAEGGEASVFITAGALVVADSASIGNILPKRRVANSAKAFVSVDGHDAVDVEVSQLAILGPLVVGPFSPAEFRISDGGRVRPNSVIVGPRGSVFLERFATDENDEVFAKSRLQVLTDIAPREDGPVTIQGGGLLSAGPSTELLCGDLTIGGPGRGVPAVCRIEGGDLGAPSSAVEVGDVSVGSLGFPGVLDLVRASITAEQFVSIDPGSVARGTGLLEFRQPSALVENRGTIIVPPGAGSVLRIEGDYVQPNPGTLVINVDKSNVAASAPFVVDGSIVQLGGTVELHFSGKRRPRPGEVFALIRSENATILEANAATYKITGAKAGFDVIVEPFGVVLAIK